VIFLWEELSWISLQPALALVGAALCRDGPRSGPDNLCCEAENLGRFAPHRDTRPLLQVFAQSLRPVLTTVLWIAVRGRVWSAVICGQYGNPLARLQ